MRDDDTLGLQDYLAITAVIGSQAAIFVPASFGFYYAAKESTDVTRSLQAAMLESLATRTPMVEGDYKSGNGYSYKASNFRFEFDGNKAACADVKPWLGNAFMLCVPTPEEGKLDWVSAAQNVFQNRVSSNAPIDIGAVKGVDGGIWFNVDAVLPRSENEKQLCVEAHHPSQTTVKDIATGITTYQRVEFKKSAVLCAGL